MFKCSMGPGLGPQGKLEGLCVGSFNNCFGKFVPFSPNKWFSTKCITLCIIMECPTWVWGSIYSTHYWPQRTKQVEPQSQGKGQLKNHGLLLFTTSHMSSWRNQKHHLVYQYVLCKPWNSKLPSKDDHCFLAFIQPIFMRCTLCRLRRER